MPSRHGNCAGCKCVLAPFASDGKKCRGAPCGRLLGGRGTQTGATTRVAPTCPWKKRSDYLDIAKLEIDLGNSTKDRHRDVEAGVGIVHLLYDALEWCESASRPTPPCSLHMP